LSVKIDGVDFTKYIEFHFSHNPDKLDYSGKGVEDEGKVVEKMLKELPKETPIRVEDTKFRSGALSSRIYKLTSINSQWEGTLFKFEINLEGV